jgi:hypothetical protein
MRLVIEVGGVDAVRAAAEVRGTCGTRGGGKR